MDNIRSSDISQAVNYLMLSDAFDMKVRHKPDMSDTAFDPTLVREEMKRQRVTQADLREVVGLTSQSAVSNILKGSRRVTAQEAAKIYAHLKLLPGGAEPVQIIPIIGLTNAGAWREAVEMPTRRMYAPRRDMGDRVFAIEVRGDSMDMLIEDGGYVIVDPDQTKLFDSKVYLIENAEYETTVKRYRGNPARFCPMSTNPDHTEFELGTGHYRVIGRVIWKGGEVE